MRPSIAETLMAYWSEVFPAELHIVTARFGAIPGLPL